MNPKCISGFLCPLLTSFRSTACCWRCKTLRSILSKHQRRTGKLCWNNIKQTLRSSATHCWKRSGTTGIPGECNCNLLYNVLVKAFSRNAKGGTRTVFHSSILLVEYFLWFFNNKYKCGLKCDKCSHSKQSTIPAFTASDYIVQFFFYFIISYYYNN